MDGTTRQTSRHIHFLGDPTLKGGSAHACCNVVDICINPRLQRVLASENDVEDESCLANVHWESPAATRDSSVITISGDQSPSSVRSSLIKTLVQDTSSLQGFIRKMYTAYKVLLVRVKCDPLAFIFQHTDQSLVDNLTADNYTLNNIFAKFLGSSSSLKSSISLKVDISGDGAFSSLSRHIGCGCFDEAMPGLENGDSTTLSSKEDLYTLAMQKIGERFKDIADELDEQKRTTKQQFTEQRNYAETIQQCLNTLTDFMTSWPEQENRADSSVSEFPSTKGVSGHATIASKAHSSRSAGGDSQPVGPTQTVKDTKAKTLGTKNKTVLPSKTGGAYRDVKHATGAASATDTSINVSARGMQSTTSSNYSSLSQEFLPGRNKIGLQGFPDSTFGNVNYVHPVDGDYNYSHRDDAATCEDCGGTMSDTSYPAYGEHSSLQKSAVNYISPSINPATLGATTAVYTILGYKDVPMGYMDNRGKYHPLVVKDPVASAVSENWATRLLTDIQDKLKGKAGRPWSAMEDAIRDDYVTQPRAERALDTVLCLDTSESVRGTVLDRIKGLAADFLTGVEEIAEQHDIEENIAVVTFGGRARVAHHLSNDYGGLRDVIDGLEAGGATPLLEGLLVSIACLTRGGMCKISGCIRVPPRVIVITDGLASDDREESDTDATTTGDMVKLRIMDAVRELGTPAAKTKVVDPVVWLPVGKMGKTFLQALATISKGVLAEETDMKTLAKYQRKQLTAGAVAAYMLNQNKPANPTDLLAKIDAAIETLAPGFGKRDKEDISMTSQEATSSLLKFYGSVFDFDNIIEVAGLPPLGSRVVRGPDWKWENQDTEGPGTLVNHGQNPETVWVLWDNGYCNMYRYGQAGAYDVLVVDDQPLMLVEGEIIQVGCQVERGPDWERSYGNQDGGEGSYGIVIRRAAVERKILVRWLNGNIQDCRYGIGGKVDVCIRDPLMSLLQSTAGQSEDCGRRDDAPSVPPASSPASSASSTVLTTREPDSAGKSQRKPPIKQVITDSVEEPPERPHAWQWLDEGEEWVMYPEEDNARLEDAYRRRRNGTCLLQRGGLSYRVSFKTNQERSVQDQTTRKIRRIPA